jgi:cystathionine beta-lyase/cystathionine gamma-synthase
MPKIATRIVHEKRAKMQNGEEPAAAPIYQTSTFAFERAEILGNTISGGPDNEVYIYTRGSNPTQRTLEKTLAQIEGSEEGLVTASGMSAIFLIGLTFLKAGDHVVISNVTYGDSHHLYDEIFRKFGVAAEFVDLTNPDNFAAAVKPNTRLVFFETPTNPLLRLIDIRAIADIAKKNKVLTVVDNTIMSPYFQQPLDLGADISVSSMSKYIGGHSDVIGGVILSDREKWLQMRFTLFSTGAVLDPNAAWLALRGVKTLEVRQKKHHDNVVKVVEFLHKHPRVLQVNHPAVADHPQHELAKTQASGYPGILSFAVEGDIAVANGIINKLTVFKRAVSLGGVESLAEHPATMTHAIIPREARLKHGIEDNLLRLSVGIEDPDDLIADLEQALSAS